MACCTVAGREPICLEAASHPSAGRAPELSQIQVCGFAPIQAMIGPMAPQWSSPFVQACELASQVICTPVVAERWQEPSVLRGLSVGGVAAHMYAAIRRFEVALDEALPSNPTVLDLPEFYGLNRVADPGGLDEGWHPLLRQDAEKRASRGADRVTHRFTEVVATTRARLLGESPDRLIPVWTVENGVTAVGVYVSTRVVELVVHSDDLATSVELGSLPIPRDAATATIETFVQMARHRAGDLGVIRAFSRIERADPEALRVF